MMLTVVGLVCQLKITFDSYRTYLKLKNSVESKFQKAHKEYVLLKEKLEKILEETNEAYKEKNVDLFKFKLEDAEYEYKSLCDKVKSIENDISFTPEEMSVLPKILAPISLFGNVCLFAFELYLNKNLDSILWNLINYWSLFIGCLGVYFAYNTSAVNEKLAKIQSDIIMEINKIKNKLNSTKRNEFYFSN